MKKKLLFVLLIIACIFLATMAAGSKNDVVNSLTSENISFENSADDNSESLLPEEPSSTESNEEDISNSSTEEVTNDELQGLWLINDGTLNEGDLAPDGEIRNINLNFTSNSTKYTSIGFILGDDGPVDRFCNIYYDSTRAYDARVSAFAWTNDNYQYINITDTLTEMLNNNTTYGEVFFAWLTANAQKVEDPLQGVWIFNDITIVVSQISIDVNFTSNGTSYTKLTFSKTETVGNTDYYDIYYDSVHVGDWNSNLTELDFDNESYYTIEIHDKITDVVNGYELLQFLQATAL